MARQNQDQPETQGVVKYTEEVAHEDTLGALAGAPEDVAKEYADTGKTPDGDWRKAQTAEDLDSLKSHGSRGRRRAQ